MTTIERPRTAADPLLEQLGLRPVINVAGSVSRLGGTTLAPEVREAMVAAATRLHPDGRAPGVGERGDRRRDGRRSGLRGVRRGGLSVPCGRRIPRRLDPGAMDRLPDTTGIRNEIVVHRAHRNPYDHALRAAGARFVEFGYLGPANPGTRRWQMESVIGERTAAVFYPGAKTAGVLPLRDVAEIAHAHGLPVIVDAAEMVPPP